MLALRRTIPTIAPAMPTNLQRASRRMLIPPHGSTLRATADRQPRLKSVAFVFLLTLGQRRNGFRLSPDESTAGLTRLLPQVSPFGLPSAASPEPSPAPVVTNTTAVATNPRTPWRIFTVAFLIKMAETRGLRVLCEGSLYSPTAREYKRSFR